MFLNTCFGFECLGQHLTACYWRSLKVQGRVKTKLVPGSKTVTVCAKRGGGGG